MTNMLPLAVTAECARRCLRGVVALVVSATFLVGCSGSLVYHPTSIAPSPATYPGTFVVATTYERNVVGGIPELENALLRQLDASRTALVVNDARRLDAAGATTPALHVGIHVRNYRVFATDPPRGGIAAIVLGSLFIVPFVFVGIPRIRTEYVVEYEVSVRSLAGVPLMVAAEDAGGEPFYDVSSIPPLFRRSYHVRVEGGRGWIRSEMQDGGDYGPYWYEVTDQLATRMVNEALPDLAAVSSQLR